MVNLPTYVSSFAVPNDENKNVWSNAYELGINAYSSLSQYIKLASIFKFLLFRILAIVPESTPIAYLILNQVSNRASHRKIVHSQRPILFPQYPKRNSISLAANNPLPNK